MSPGAPSGREGGCSAWLMCTGHLRRARGLLPLVLSTGSSQQPWEVGSGVCGRRRGVVASPQHAMRDHTAPPPSKLGVAMGLTSAGLRASVALALPLPAAMVTAGTQDAQWWVPQKSGVGGGGGLE